MAQTGSAQREPSMEEILASIRRIIEDSDQGAPPTEQPAVDAAEVAPAGDAEDVDAFRAELDEPLPSMADIQNSLRAEEAEPAPVARIHPLRPEQHAAPDVEPESRDDVELPSTVEMTSPAGDAAMDEGDEDGGYEAASAETGTEAAMQAPVETKSSLISDVTERQVVAAFGELSDAFAASRRRSFDEMAEEMLRPMLQDWLDNNLPGLVEKLVREEIERVARGGKA